MTITNSIKNWAEDERPREKLLHKGAPVLSDAELLAILISSGTKERSALDLARDILKLADNDLHTLGRLSVQELQQTKGIGEARAITIAAALELGRRRQLSAGLSRQSITQSKDAAEIFIPLMRDLGHEVFYVLYLSQSGGVIRCENIGKGGLTGTVADIRIILKNALLYSAARLIVSHNHPSGNLKPSKEDIAMTTKLKEAATLMDIKLLDHIIVGNNNYCSMADEGII
ncbi:MAG: DNA repair protein RadC [Chitinophagaceae bacterium]|nr:DNA repair protein RadC [Chitinophagaceae bacterium]MCB9047471.1 DNA repair protein RadC [Chitinophagales bacterium]